MIHAQHMYGLLQLWRIILLLMKQVVLSKKKDLPFIFSFFVFYLFGLAHWLAFLLLEK